MIDMKHEGTPHTAFGELRTAEITPVVQIDALYGLRTRTDVETFSATNGSVSVVDNGSGNEFKCATGTDVGGYGLIRSLRAVKYRPGQGLIYRWTARYDAGVALCAIRSGPVTLGNELSFGYNGVDFGVLYRRGGKPEIRRLTIGTPANGNETLTITLNSVPFTVAVTSGTAAFNAYQIEASHIASTTFTGWNVSQNGSTVIFSATSVGAKSGTFSLSSTGAAVGTFATSSTGAAVIDSFIDQSDWNVDPMNGNGPSGYTFNPQKYNVYQISQAYLGAGCIHYDVMLPNTGKFHTVHRIEYPGTSTMPNSSQPSYKIGWFAASLGSSTNVTINGVSAMGAVDGKRVVLRSSDGQSNEKTSVGTSLTNIISIRVRDEFKSVTNLQSVIPVTVTAAIAGTKNGVIQIIKNGVLGGTTNWTYHDENGDSIEYDTAGTTVTLDSGSSQVLDLQLAKETSILVDMEKYGIDLVRGDILTVAAKATSGTITAAASITWIED
jgi:hypothetical protein